MGATLMKSATAMALDAIGRYRLAWADLRAWVDLTEASMGRTPDDATPDDLWRSLREAGQELREAMENATPVILARFGDGPSKDAVRWWVEAVHTNMGPIARLGLDRAERLAPVSVEMRLDRAEAVLKALDAPVKVDGEKLGPLSRVQAAAADLKESGERVSVRAVCSLAGVERAWFKRHYPSDYDALVTLSRQTTKREPGVFRGR